VTLNHSYILTGKNAAHQNVKLKATGIVWLTQEYSKQRQVGFHQYNTQLFKIIGVVNKYRSDTVRNVGKYDIADFF